MIRASTQEKYEKFLLNIAGLKEPFNLEEVVANAAIDVKIAMFLRKNNYVKPTAGTIDKVLANFPTYDAKMVLDSFVQWRDALNAIGEQDRKDLAYYKKNKEFLVDVRQTGTVPAAERDKIRNELINEVVLYAEMAVKLGKQDIAGFITTLLKTK